MLKIDNTSSSIKNSTLSRYSLDKNQANKNNLAYNNFSTSNITFGNKFTSKVENNIDNFTNKLFLKLAELKPLKSFIDWSTKETYKKNIFGQNILSKNTEKLTQLLIISFSAILQTNYIVNIIKNKDIPKERKEALCVNNALTFVIPTIGALTLDKAVNKLSKRFENYLKSINKNNISEEALSGVHAAKSLLIFSFMYKFASTIIALPIGEKITTYLRQKGIFSEEQNKNAC